MGIKNNAICAPGNWSVTISNSARELIVTEREVQLEEGIPIMHAILMVGKMLLCLNDCIEEGLSYQELADYVRTLERQIRSLREAIEAEQEFTAIKKEDDEI